MEAIAKIIESVASVLWPLIVVVVILVFRPGVSAIIESAKSRKFTLKIGGQELTMDEVHEQQRILIADLQTQIVELKKKVEDRTDVPEELESVSAISQAKSSATISPTTILWVDDHPKNNSYFVEQLDQLGIKVDLALSTVEGIEKFKRGKYAYIISDMGRTENGTYNAAAGLDLLENVREISPSIPFVFFCSSSGVQEFGQQAKRLGATMITDSPTNLFGILGLNRAEVAP